MLPPMDDAEIARLRRAIQRSFGSSPHKKKYWLALLEMQIAAEKAGRSRIAQSSPKPHQDAGN
jgi:hypothetical protein